LASTGEEIHFVTPHIQSAIARYRLERGLLSETKLLWGAKKKRTITSPGTRRRPPTVWLGHENAEKGKQQGA
jgi:hypothetical protein